MFLSYTVADFSQRQIRMSINATLEKFVGSMQCDASRWGLPLIYGRSLLPSASLPASFLSVQCHYVVARKQVLLWKKTNPKPLFLFGCYKWLISLSCLIRHHSTLQEYWLSPHSLRMQDFFQNYYDICHFIPFYIFHFLIYKCLKSFPPGSLL